MPDIHPFFSRAHTTSVSSAPSDGRLRKRKAALVRSRPKEVTEWSRARPFDKLAEAYAEIADRGGKVFTLRLRQDVLDRVVAAKDPGRAIVRRIQAKFREHGIRPPLLAFSLEVTEDTRNELHLHGAVLLDRVELATMKKLLRSAAGWIEGRSGSRQVQIKSFDEERGGASGWANYGSKCTGRTRRTIEHDRITYISDDLLRASRSRWEQRRVGRSPVGSRLAPPATVAGIDGWSV